MKKIIIFGMILVILVLVGCVENTYVPKDTTKEEVIKKPTCNDECSQPTCEGLYYVDCLMGADLCKHKQNKEKIMGKCGVECLEHSDCESDFLCSSNKCEEACPQLDEINVFEWKSITGSKYFRLNYSYNEESVEGYNLSWSFYVQCEKGTKEGENVNYWYCGKNPDFWGDNIHFEKKIISPEGNITKHINKKAYSVYDKNFNFIETVCFS